MIAVLHHPMIPRSQPLAQEVKSWVEERGETTWVGSIWDETTVRERLAGTSLLIALGGDGSILRAARVAAARHIPVFSINLGKLGFLSESSPDNWKERLAKVLAGEFRRERRLMLHAHIYRCGEVVGELMALNEIVVGRGSQARVVRFHLHVDGNHVTSYIADALIATTPTGSTAYSLAAGGPIMPPELPNYAIVPVAPHLSLDRAIVLYEKAEVTIEVDFDHEASITADGQDAMALQSADVVRIAKAPFEAVFVRVDDPSYFYRRLMARGSGLGGGT
jgi:NAD+ kinase